MMRFSVRRGLRFQAKDGRKWTLDRFIPSGRLQLISDEGHLETITESDLLSRWSSHEWHVEPESLKKLQEQGSLQIARDLSSYSPAQVAKAEYRYCAIQPLLKSKHVTAAKVEERARELRELHHYASRRSLERWLAAYRVARDKTALIDARRCRRGRRSETFEQLFEQAINEVFLSKERASPSRVFMELGRLIAHHNHSHPEDTVRAPSRATFFRRMQQLNIVAVDRERLGRFEANKRHRTALKHADARCLLDRVEVDHTLLDVILIDGRTGKPLGRPWLTVAIDVYSRMIVGIHLTFDAPSCESVLQCLKFGILPKSHLRQKFPDLQNDWPVAGLFRTVVFDNGLDAHGGRVRYFCEEIGSSIQYCPSRTPWYKGTIERFFRTLNEGLLHSLPGTTFSNPRHRAGYPSEHLCQMDRADFLKVLVRWIVDVYHVTPHSGTGMPPLVRWQQNAAHSIVDLPLSPADLDLLTAKRMRRCIHHYGIEIDRIKYNSPELQHLFRGFRFTKENKDAAVEVRYHEETVEHIEVLDPKSQTFLRVPAVDTEYTAGLDRHTHTVIKRTLARQFGRAWRLEDRREALAEIRQVVEAAGQSKRKLTRAAKRREALINRPNTNSTDPTPRLVQMLPRARPLVAEDGELPDLPAIDLMHSPSGAT
jgi:putative transposase